MTTESRVSGKARVLCGFLKGIYRGLCAVSSARALSGQAMV